MIKVLIVDDHEIARATLKQLISQVKDLELIGECERAVEAYRQIQDHPVDLVLLDIEMPEMTGLELIKNLQNKRPFIIFTTAKKEYAVDAFEINVVDYLVKPIAPGRFFQAIEKLREVLQSHPEVLKGDHQEFIFIRDTTIIRRLKIDEILYVEAMGDYVKFYTAQKFFAVHTTLKAVEERLPSSIFLRIHRSYIIAIDKIDSIEDGILIINKKLIPVADSYRAALNQRLNIL